MSNSAEPNTRSDFSKIDTLPDFSKYDISHYVFYNAKNYIKDRIIEANPDFQRADWSDFTVSAEAVGATDMEGRVSVTIRDPKVYEAGEKTYDFTFDPIEGMDFFSDFFEGLHGQTFTAKLKDDLLNGVSGISEGAFNPYELEDNDAKIYLLEVNHLWASDTKGKKVKISGLDECCLTFMRAVFNRSIDIRSDFSVDPDSVKQNYIWFRVLNR